MPNIEEIIQEMRQRPDLISIIKRLEKEMEEEHKKREAFSNLIHEDMKAEFINGEVIYHSPVKNKHWSACTNLSAYMTVFVNQHKLGKVGTEKVLIRCTRNDYEPDIVFFTKEKADKFTPDQMIFPTPDLAVEILSESTKERDYGIKYQDYAAHGVSEYWIIDPDNQSIEQFTLQNGKYELYQKLVKEGLIKSVAIKGFTIEISEIF